MDELHQAIAQAAVTDPEMVGIVVTSISEAVTLLETAHCVERAQILEAVARSLHDAVIAEINLRQPIHAAIANYGNEN